MRVIAVAALGLLAACKSTLERRVDADREAYRALDARRGQVDGVAGSLDLDRADEVARPARAVEELTLDLEQALRLAAAASREYRATREDAYLAALALSDQRNAFAFQKGLGGAIELSRDADGGAVVGGPTASLGKAFETGGSFVATLALDFLRTFAGLPTSGTTSLLAAEVLLPLVRGAGPTAREPLTQAERDVLYALRRFARFQQELVVRVASGFYAVLEARDVVANEDATYESLTRLFERARDFGPAGAGRLADFAVDQARQDVLLSEERRQQARRFYESTLDGFKLELGVPVSTRVTLDGRALEAMRERGVDAAELDVPALVRTALARRVDLATARDEVDDAVRRVAVAENALGADVDLTVSGGLDTPASRPQDLRRATGRGAVGLGIDLPIERTPERNAYRAAEIEAERARRAREALHDRVVADVRDDARTLMQAGRSFTTQRESVRLAVRRVESTKLDFQRVGGRATIRDVLESETALVQARNALTAALVDHAVATLELARDTGTLDASLLASPRVPPPTPAPAPTAGQPTPGTPSPEAPPPPPPAPPTSAPASAPR